MSVLVPLPDRGHEPSIQVFLAGEVHNPQPLARENAEPLLYLIHPRAVYRWVMEDKARMLFQPSSQQLSFVHGQVVQYYRDGGDVSWNLAL